MEAPRWRPRGRAACTGLGFRPSPTEGFHFPEPTGAVSRYLLIMGSLRREVIVPVPSYRRPSSLIGLSIMLMLLASSVDAMVWSYQIRRQAEIDAQNEMVVRPAPRRQDSIRPSLQDGQDVAQIKRANGLPPLNVQLISGPDSATPDSAMSPDHVVPAPVVELRPLDGCASSDPLCTVPELGTGR